MSHKGILVFINQQTGEIDSDEMTLPIETNSSLLMWSVDFWRAFLERPKIFRWITKLSMGKYAFRELYGTRECIEKQGYSLDINFIGYELTEMGYHKDKVKI